mgnify:FL=1
MNNKQGVNVPLFIFLGIGMYRARSLYRGTFDIDVFCNVVAVEMVQVQINF